MDGKAVNKNKKKKILAAAISAVAAVMAATGAVVAFLSKTVESRANNFTFVTADVKLDEPSWHPEEPHVITPGQTVSKDPTVENTGETPLYVFLEVKIPCAEVQTVNADKTLGEKKRTNLLTFTTNSDWVKVSEEDKIVIEKDKQYCVEVYAYLKELAPKGKSSALFNTVTYANVIEGELGDKIKFDMPISVYAIQSENVAEISGTVEDKLKKAYETYMK